MKIEKILIPVDGSDTSMRAAEYATNLAELAGGEITLMHCHKPFPLRLGEPYFQRAINKVMEKSNLLMDPYKTMLKKKGIPFTDKIMEGPARESIIRVAEIEECDLIVMGSRGLSDLTGLVLGSVTHRVLRSAPCPVLVIR